MRLFDLPQAQYFCNPVPSITNGITAQSLTALHDALPSSLTVMVEGATHFSVHQVCMLESVQRWLMYGLAHYRRAMDMMVPVSAPWAHATLYYSSFFAANATLAMFGGWVGSSRTGTRVIDVENGSQGSQALRVNRKLSSPAGARGSHRIFWDFYYDAGATISAWAPGHLQAALQPVNGDFAWQANERNCINYDMFDAWKASKAFHSTFRPERLASLRGPLQLQLETTQKMMNLALWFASEMGLPASAVADCGGAGSRQQIQRRLVTQRPPALVSQSAMASLLEA